MNSVRISIGAGVAYGILAVVLSLYSFSPTPIAAPSSWPGQVHMLFGTLFYICEMLYIYGFVIVGQKYQSSFLVGTSWILVASVAAQIPSSFAILLSPGFGTEPLPWFFYACNFCEGLAGVAFGVSLIRLRIMIGRRATLTGVATIILYVCYAISSTPQLATELVLLASVGTGLLVLSDYLSM